MQPRPIQPETPGATQGHSTIAVLGTNYVGLVTAACLAQLGHTVIGIDIDPLKVARLERGQLPIYEPGLEGLVLEQLGAGRLRFTLDYAETVPRAAFAFICVGTPSGPDGNADMSQVRAATESLARHVLAGAHLVVINKSTVPVGSGQWMQTLLDARGRRSGANFSVVSNPEFLREGSAVSDFQHPDRIVLGGSDPAALESVAMLYSGLRATPPIVRTDLHTAEMIKYASNAFLASKISFINEMAAICDQLGADVTDVALGMGLDQRIGPDFLAAGVGYGGSCFPKDVLALERMATQAGTEPRVLRAVIETNRQARDAVIAEIRAALGTLHNRRVGILGLAFKSDTDDVRESPALDIARTLLAEGARVSAYDPVATRSATLALPQLDLREDAYAVAEGAEVLLLLTGWPEFQHLDFVRVRASMRRPLLFDGRNVLDPAAMRALGFRYRGIGRGVAPAAMSALTIAA
jgi:UDPglucose 6-dehydrogenase